MENKINIAELLKDCPKGMELDCVMWDNIVFSHIDKNSNYPICIIKMDGEKEYLTEDGHFNFNCGAKCVIFPKGKTTWEGFVPPCQFKTGDVIYVRGMSNQIAIYKENIYNRIYDYVSINVDNEFTINRDNIALIDCSAIRDIRLATEEEKAKLFQAIKDNGYYWNPETKTLGKLPRFKIGDIIQDEDGYKVKITEVNLEDECYGYKSIIAKGIGGIAFSEQDNWELVPNKFDITTLKPFDKVLVRCSTLDNWRIQLFEKYHRTCQYPFICLGYTKYKQCIPHEGNEHLLDTKDDCDDFYKTWE